MRRSGRAIPICSDCLEDCLVCYGSESGVVEMKEESSEYSEYSKSKRRQPLAFSVLATAPSQSIHGSSTTLFVRRLLRASI